MAAKSFHFDNAARGHVYEPFGDREALMMHWLAWLLFSFRGRIPRKSYWLAQTRVGADAVEQAMKRVALLTLIALALSAVALLIYMPMPMRLIVSALLANWRPPAIARAEMTDQDWTQDATRKFTAVLARKFPKGTKENALISVLVAQGFRFPERPPDNCIPPGQPPPIGVVYYGCLTEEQEKVRQRTLVYEWGPIVCVDRVSVRWSADDHGVITNIDGTYRQICP